MQYENDDKYRTPTNQTISALNNLEGEHTCIAKGDNCFSIDSEVIPADNVVGIINEDRYFKLQSLDTWSCSIID